MAKPSLNPTQISTHLSHILRIWPKDLLRNPALTFQHIISKRLPNTTTNPTQSSNPAAATSSSLPTSADINALYSLLENRYASAYPMPESLMKPAGQPGYYEAFAKEIERAPGRGLVGRWVMKLKGMVRWT